MPPARIWLGPALMTAAMLCVAIALGTWQVHRLAWKEAILRQIEAGEHAAPVPLGPDPAPFTEIVAVGTFRPGVSAIYGAEVRDTPTGPEMGGQLLMLLDRPGAPSLLVDRGWVATSRPRPVATPTGPVRVSGFVRAPDRPGLFSARDDVQGRQFFTLDPQAIAAALGAGPVAPFTLVALGSGTAAAYPEPARHLPRPPNNHLSYAITWYGLGAALAVIFGVWLRGAARRARVNSLAEGRFAIAGPALTSRGRRSSSRQRGNASSGSPAPTFLRSRRSTTRRRPRASPRCRRAGSARS